MATQRHSHDTGAAEKEKKQARLSELELEAHLKKNIISQAQVYYGPNYPVGSTFDVISERSSFRIGEGTATAWLVVYPEPNNFTKWECITVNLAPSATVVDALESLLSKLQGAHGWEEFTLQLGMTSNQAKARYDKKFPNSSS